MTLRYCPTVIESDNSAVRQYESLRSQVLNQQERFAEPSLGLALFIRQGDAGLDRGLPPIHTSTFNQAKAATTPRLCL